MTHRLPQTLIGACLRLLRPLARIALRHGMTAYDFARVANIAFVRAARDILREQGKTLSFSRVSTITGLHRHVVSNIVNSAGSEGGDSTTDKEYRRNRLARVLQGWYENPLYTDPEGRPRVLALEGPTPSFASLVRDFSGDIYPKIILDELVEVGAVKLQRNDAVRAVRRRFSVGGAEPSAVEHLGSTLRDVISTLEHNLRAPPERRLYDDSVVSLKLDPAAIPLLQRLVRERGAAFLEDMEGWIAEHERTGTDEAVRAGVIVQMFVEPEIEKEKEPDTPRSA